MHIIQVAPTRLEVHGGVQSVIKTLTAGFRDQGFTASEVSLPSLNPFHNMGNGTSNRVPLLTFEDQLDDLLNRHGDAVAVLSHNLHFANEFSIADHFLARINNSKCPHLALIHDVGVADESSAAVINKVTCLTTSDYNRRELELKFGKRDVPLIPPPLDFSKWESTKDSSPLCIAYPGRLTPGKGILDAITFLGLLSLDLGPLTVKLANKDGQAYGETHDFTSFLLESAARFPNLKLNFHDEKHGLMTDFYSEASLMLAMPIRAEGFNLSALECLACGRPVIATVTGGMSWLQDIDACITFNKRDAVLLAKAISTVTDDLDTWHEKALNSRALLQNVHDVKVVANAYVHHFSDLF